MAAIASQIYFRFPVWPRRNGRRIEILLPVSISTFSQSSACGFLSAHQISSKSDHPRQSNDVIAIFKMAAVSHVGFASASGGLCIILKFRLDRIYSFRDTAIFIFWHFGYLTIHAHFRGFAGIFSQMTSSIFITPKGTSLHGNTSFES